MENDELIELPYAMSFLVDMELSLKYGIDKAEEYNEISDYRFTREELSKIETIVIPVTKPGFLAGVEKLPNLKHLVVENADNNAYTLPSKIASITDEDISCIEKCKNLESLSITNQPDITYIDLSGMPKLHKLNISHNVNLETISGIDDLKELKSLTCVGNHSLQDIKGLDKTIIQNRDNLEEMDFDVLLFPEAIGYRPFNGSYNQEAMNAIEYINGGITGTTSMAFTGDKVDGKVNWSEYLNPEENIKIGTHSMLKMHNQACQILQDILPRNGSTLDTVVAIERYLAENVTYDYESREHDRTKSALTSTGPNGVRVQLSHKNGINGAYDCLVHKSCVCQGYTRGEQYLLALKGIKSHEVHCLTGLGYDYHSIIRVDDCYNLYSDPCWNACRYQQGDKTLPYSLLTKEEISKDHMLSFEERSAGSHQQTISRPKIAESIEYNTLFRNSRTSEVSAQRAILGQNVIGIVRSADGRAY